MITRTEATAVVSAAVRPSRARAIGPVALASIMLIVVAALAVTMGASTIPPLTTLAIILDRLPFVTLAVDAPVGWQRIVLDVRLPRVLTAGLAGAALAYSGATYQGVFRNPLADPFLLGVASGAALGAAIAIMTPLDTGPYGFGWVPLFAFVGAALAVVLAYSAARVGLAVSNTSLILAGVAVSSVAGAVTSFIMLNGGERALAIFAFLFGSFNTANWERAALALPYLAVGTAVIAIHGRLLNVLQLDEEQAAQLGVNVARTKLVLLAAASLIAATAVAMAGVIGFVGLVVPHLVRLLFGTDYRRVLPLAALIGASFLIGADVLSRTLLRPQEVPVGIVTAVIGGPFFLYVMRTRRIGGGL